MDSSARIVACLQAAAAELALPVIEKSKLSEIIGLSLADCTQRIYPQLNPQQVQQFAQTYRNHYFYKNTDPSPLFDNVLTMLTAFKAQGYYLAVATGKGRKGLQQHLDELAMHKFFVCTKTAEETASKPNPLMLQEILTELDVDKDQAVMIGDTTYDIDMAKAIDMPNIAIAQGAQPAETLAQSAPDFMLQSIQELPELLAQH